MISRPLFSCLVVTGCLLVVAESCRMPAVAAGELAAETERTPPWPGGPFVILRDGGVLAARLRELTAERVTIDTTSFGRLVLPRASVLGFRRGIRIGPPLGPLAGSLSRVTLANEDQLETAAVTVEAAVLSLHRNAGLATGRRPLTLPLARVLAIDLRAVDTPNAGGGQRDIATGRWVALEDGSRLRCRNPKVDVTTAGQGEVSLQPVAAGLPTSLRCPANEIAVVESGDPSLRLAETEPAGRVVPAGWPLTRGRSVTGEWPRLRGQTGFTAIGLHAPATVLYRFDKPVFRFTAVVGIDDSAGQGGSVVVRVAAGQIPSAPTGRRALDFPTGMPAEATLAELFRSPVLRGGDAPLTIDLPLAAATGLKLEVQPADGGTVLDRTLWLDARVWCEPAESRD